MKKILSLVIAMMFINIALAQFKVEQKQNTPEAIWRNGFSWLTLYQHDLGNGEYYYMFGLRTTNQYDGILLLHLGNKEKTISTLLQLQNELYAEGKIYNLTDDKGESFTLICQPLNYYNVTKNGYAGCGCIRIGQLSTILSLFE